MFGLPLRADALASSPAALHEMLLALDFFIDTPPQIVLIWPEGQGVPATFADPLLGATEGAELDALARLAPIAAGKTTLAGQATAYVCEQGACRLPSTDPAAMKAQLAAIKAVR